METSPFCGRLADLLSIIAWSTLAMSIKKYSQHTAVATQEYGLSADCLFLGQLWNDCTANKRVEIELIRGVRDEFDG